MSGNMLSLFYFIPHVTGFCNSYICQFSGYYFKSTLEYLYSEYFFMILINFMSDRYVVSHPEILEGGDFIILGGNPCHPGLNFCHCCSFKIIKR